MSEQTPVADSNPQATLNVSEMVAYHDKIVEKLNQIGPEVSIVEKCNAVLATDFRGLKKD